jgi:ABC-type multidrug transport system ATPase subunit
VRYAYGVTDFSATLKVGKIYGLSAPSGGGKTTLLLLMSRCLKPTGGTVDSNDAYGYAVLFEEPELLPHLTVSENVALPLAGIYRSAEALPLVEAALRVVGMWKYRNRKPEALSYGMKRLVALARALAYPSPYLLLDEPFKGLDWNTSQRIIHHLQRLMQVRKQVVVFTSHHKQELSELADETLILF